jgi:hypothetical protein
LRPASTKHGYHLESSLLIFFQSPAIYFLKKSVFIHQRRFFVKTILILVTVLLFSCFNIDYFGVFDSASVTHGGCGGGGGGGGTG